MIRSRLIFVSVFWGRSLSLRTLYVYLFPVRSRDGTLVIGNKIIKCNCINKTYLLHSCMLHVITCGICVQFEYLPDKLTLLVINLLLLHINYKHKNFHDMFIFNIAHEINLRHFSFRIFLRFSAELFYF